MDDVDDILNQNQVVEEDLDEEEEEEDDDDETGMIDGEVNIGGDESQQDEDEDDENGEDDEDEDADNDQNDDEDEDMDDEDEDDENNDDEEDNRQLKDSTQNEINNNGNKTNELSEDDNSNKETSETTGEKGANEESGSSTNDVGSKSPSVEKSSTPLTEKVYNYYLQMLQSSKIAESYSMYPSAAIPIQTHVNALAVTKGLKYLFLGGNDGYIRKYDLLNTLEGKLSLTILQKHSLAESIQNAGILQSYWENEIPQRKSQMKITANNKEYEPKVSPVYSLEVQSEALFLLSGLNNGGITMQGVRYMEGNISHYFKEGPEGHSNVVNILRLNGDEDKFISGSWDRKILEWDLQTGKRINGFKGATSELSALEMRPLYSSISLNDIRSVVKSSEDADDDIDSLFGDDDDEDMDATSHPNDDDESKINASTSGTPQISSTTLNIVYDQSVFMTSGLNGSLHLWDRRNSNSPVINFERGPNTPPWCLSACWSADGDRIYAGRRNACVEEFNVKMPSKPSNTLKLPSISGPVSCVRSMPNNKQILCASKDNIRLYNIEEKDTKGSTVPFLIVPGHHGGTISNMYVDPTCRFMVSTSGNRGWQGTSTDTTLIYDIDLV
ncbi:hypothetical protein NCAS_0J00460 [Naumovozyma castellii]|uniref:Transcription factor spt8 beta-propeller domain-containing protein n=1 Tax=Naumovozyma castellii TaxID=27288 RepID=G0VKI9_NAUCA|nr:hypothetical protein NCAS_0J00460 [Naumovozyma castellii CBS 4309]CCC72025.1 hypothetical protein NCAS_0J00460 [Naumovozyma castellii CBS 4309]